MAFIPAVLIFFCSLLQVIHPSTAAGTSFWPKALVLPVSKDSLTLQCITHINQRTPQVPLKLTLDVGGQYLWVDCEQGYVSSSYKPARYRSAQCSLVRADTCSTGREGCIPTEKPGCNYDTCGLFPDNTVTRVGSFGEVAMDILSFQSTDGSNTTRVVSAPNFIFTCAFAFLLNGLANGVKGMAGLGRIKISLHFRGVKI